MPGGATHPALPFLRSPEKGKVVTAADAVRLIRDGDAVATGDFVGIGFAEEIAIALEERFLADAVPRGRQSDEVDNLLLVGDRRHPLGHADAEIDHAVGLELEGGAAGDDLGGIVIAQVERVAESGSPVPPHRPG